MAIRMDDMLRELLYDSELVAKSDYFAYLDQIYRNEANRSEVIAFLTALSVKELKVHDVVCFTEYIRQLHPPKVLRKSRDAINIVGTGGGIATFNISTTAAFVASAAGAVILKSGSYKYKSRCGSLDLLKALGIKPSQSEPFLDEMLEELDIGFVGPNLYSPFLNRLAMSVLPLNLKIIGRFINRIGPLLCPFQVSGQLTGVSEQFMLKIIGQALHQLQMQNSIVVWADIGMDEFSSIGTNYIAMVGNQIESDRVGKDQHGFEGQNIKNLSGGDPIQNAEITRLILRDQLRTDALDTVVLNCAQTLILAGKVENFKDGIECAQEVIQNGKALKKLNDVIEFCADMKANSHIDSHTAEKSATHQT